MSRRRFSRFAVALIAVGAAVGLFWSALSKSSGRSTGPTATPGKPTDSSNDGPPSASAGQVAGSRPRPTGAGPTTMETGSLVEAQMMARLRQLAETDPEAAITLAREGNRRFPNSADAPERTSILIHGLVAVGRPSEARGEAETMVNQYADSSWVREIERFTGAHRHRTVYVTDAGTIGFR